MLRFERHAKILQLVRERDFVENDELSEIFGVTTATIRRDAKILKEQGLVSVDHGGISVIDYLKAYVEPAHETKIYLNIEKKKAIADTACKLINEGETVILDSGTTNLQIAKRLKNRQFKHITIVTADLKIANELCVEDNVKLIMLGGTVRKLNYSTYGPFAEQTLKQIKADKFFLGIDSICLGYGITNIIQEEVPLKQLSISLSDEVIAVADSSKFETHVTYKICTIDEIDYLITDSDLDMKIISEIEKKGVKLISVNS